MRRSTQVIAAWLVVLGIVVSGAKAADLPPLAVVVLHPGTGEMQELRYVFVPGLATEMVMTTRTTAKTAMGGREMPGGKVPLLTTRIGTTTVDTNAAGDAQVDLEYASSRGSDIKGKAVLNNRGIVKSLAFDLPAGSPPIELEQTESLRQNTPQYFVPLPEEPVGEGAKWQVIQPMMLDGMKIEQITQYTLVSREVDSLKLEVEIAQSAAEQDFERPKTPGMQVHLKAHTGSGKGTGRVQLNIATATSTKMEMSGETTIAMPQIGELMQSMQTTMTGTTTRQRAKARPRPGPEDRPRPEPTRPATTAPATTAPAGR